ncbi:hypothetical protein BH23CHL8_BH23CHL8_31930 [soil metagenome]
MSPRPSFRLGCLGNVDTGASWASMPKRSEPMHLRIVVAYPVVLVAVRSRPSMAMAPSPTFAVTLFLVVIVALLGPLPHQRRAGHPADPARAGFRLQRPRTSSSRNVPTSSIHSEGPLPTPMSRSRRMPG